MKEQEIFIHRFAANIRKLLSDAVKTSYDLFKIIVPISILTKLLSEAGVIDYLGFALSPVMELVGVAFRKIIYQEGLGNIFRLGIKYYLS
ncbi:nucleoside recognition domain-containing protein [Desulfovulcanus sp.]